MGLFENALVNTFGTAGLGAGLAGSLEVVVVVVVVLGVIGFAAGFGIEDTGLDTGTAGFLAAGLEVSAGLEPFSPAAAAVPGADLGLAVAVGIGGLVVVLGVIGLAAGLAATLAAGLAESLDAVFAAGFNSLLGAAGLGGSAAAAEFSSAFSFCSTSGSATGVGASLL